MFNSYIEGWALYAEQLAWEYGYQDDPFSNLGRLQGELFRAVRVVVDKGIHVKKWSREKAIEYLLSNTGLPEYDVTAEIERYIVSPGQSCSYKIGMMELLRFREMAQDELRNEFNIKDFHDVVLNNGAMPMNVLELVVRKYFESKKKS